MDILELSVSYITRYTVIYIKLLCKAIVSAWMDTPYNWSDPEFMDECGESLNLVVNAVAEVLHALYIEAHTERAR